jgi:hypothetical protein
MDDKDNKNIVIHNSMTRITKVVVNKIENGVQTSHTLSGEELEQWKKEHGFINNEGDNEK